MLPVGVVTQCHPARALLCFDGRRGRCRSERLRGERGKRLDRRLGAVGRAGPGEPRLGEGPALFGAVGVVWVCVAAGEREQLGDAAGGLVDGRAR